jgi:hypothetical protein
LGLRWPEQDGYEATNGRIVPAESVHLDGICILGPASERATAAGAIVSELQRGSGDHAAAVWLERFNLVVGRDLEDWLQQDFFRRHIQQFNRRPCVWHLTSPERGFQALILYNRLSRDTLRRLRDVYAGTRVNNLKAELGRAQARKDNRGIESLRAEIEDVEVFRDLILAIEEGRDLHNRIRCPWKGEAKTGRAGPYSPDLDDGVKVNIRPFQETGLLAREVIKRW